MRREAESGPYNSTHGYNAKFLPCYLLFPPWDIAVLQNECARFTPLWMQCHHLRGRLEHTTPFSRVAHDEYLWLSRRTVFLEDVDSTIRTTKHIKTRYAAFSELRMPSTRSSTPPHGDAANSVSRKKERYKTWNTRTKAERFEPREGPTGVSAARTPEIKRTYIQNLHVGRMTAWNVSLQKRKLFKKV